MDSQAVSNPQLWTTPICAQTPRALVHIQEPVKLCYLAIAIVTPGFLEVNNELQSVFKGQPMMPSLEG